MTKKEYMEFHKSLCDRMMEITKAKNSDYTGTGDDPFANFRVVEEISQGAVSVEAGFLTRMSDKFSRISSFVSGKKLLVKDESVQDTLLDLSNYCLLMIGYIKDSQEREAQRESLLRNMRGEVDAFKETNLQEGSGVNR